MHICIHMCVCVCTCIRVNSLAPNPPGGVPTAAQAVSGRGEAAGHAPHRPFLPQDSMYIVCIYIQPTPCVPFCSRRRVLRVNPEVPAR